MKTENIYCCACKQPVKARLTDGEEIYPHRSDLFSLPFWKCDSCKNFIGCHHKTAERTKPLGNIPTVELKEARKHIHKILDPLWKGKKQMRGKLYKKISEFIGYDYHTGEIKTLEDARKVYGFIKSLQSQQEEA